MAEIDGGFEITMGDSSVAPVRYRDDYAIHPDVAVLTERVVATVRAFNRRLGWIDDPASLDRVVRDTVSQQLGFARREHRHEWPSQGLWSAAVQLQAELAEETTEPWPLRAADHPPGRRESPEPHIRIEGDIAHISYGDPSCTQLSLDPIRLAPSRP